jgi:DNA-binding MarR family transcriptional regulator
MLEQWLKTLQLENVAQWDLLTFLHRHRSALVTAEDIARLMGYQSAPIVAALESLETLGIVERSRLSQGARLYELTRLSDPRDRALAELLALNETRSGRIRILKKLRQTAARKAITLVVAAGQRGYGG